MADALSRIPKGGQDAVLVRFQANSVFENALVSNLHNENEFNANL